MRCRGRSDAIRCTCRRSSAGAAAIVRSSRFRRRQPGEADRRIAGFVAERIPNGATIQTGIGAIPNAIMAALRRPSRSRHPHRTALRRRRRTDRGRCRERGPQAAEPDQDRRHVRAGHRPAARVPAREHRRRVAHRAVRERSADHRQRAELRVGQRHPDRRLHRSVRVGDDRRDATSRRRVARTTSPAARCTPRAARASSCCIRPRRAARHGSFRSWPPATS